MSGLYSTRRDWSEPQPLGVQLRALREKAGVSGWEPAAAAKMDSGSLSKIENGKRPPTQAQLAALAKFYKAPLAPLEARRVAEDMKRRYGDHPNFVEATAILREEPGEYRANNAPKPVNKLAKPVSKQRKSQ